MKNKIEKRDRKAVSLMISYVLLIGIVVGVAVLVFGFLKYYVPRNSEQCPDDISFVIKEYSCNTAEETISLALINKGYHNIEGVFARGTADEDKNPTTPLNPLIYHGDTITTNGMYYFKDTLAPSAEVTIALSYEDLSDGDAALNPDNEIKKLQLQAFRSNKANTDILLCENAITTQDIDCVGVEGPKPPPGTENLVSWWKFDGDVLDSGGGGNHGINNRITFTAGNAGKVGEALLLRFDPAGYINIPHSSNFPSDRFTIELWLKPGNPFLPLTILNKEGDYKIYIKPDKKIEANIDGTTLTSLTQISVGTWYFVAVTFDGSNANLYVGSESNVPSVSSSSLSSISYGSNNLLIGKDIATNPNFVGAIDELAIYGIALNSDTINEHYRRSNAGNNYFTPLSQ